MQHVAGDAVQLNGRVAYVPQAAFIYNATIRDNILFGMPYEEERYAHAVEASALIADLMQMPGGRCTFALLPWGLLYVFALWHLVQCLSLSPCHDP